MVCYHPLKAWRSQEGGVTFSVSNAWVDKPITLPCGQCVGCRLERSRQWAVRCMHEAQCHEQNCFITLTYSPENEPQDRGLHKRDHQLFLKRLRKRYTHRIRYYLCGEYGAKYGRPHYHACLFGHDFKDKRPWRRIGDNVLYRSEELESLWTVGYSSVGALTFQSAAYVARYIMKKVTGNAAEDHYSWVDDDGVVNSVQPEYTAMSRRPGIGSQWLDKFGTDVYPSDFVLINGKRARPPRYYDARWELTNPKELQEVKRERRRKAKDREEDLTPERLRVREYVQKRRLDKLGESIED